MLTLGGLAFAYTINAETDGFVHHYSISVPGHPTPSAIGETFTFYIALLLGIAPEHLTIAVSEAGFYHTEFTLSAEEEAAFADRQIRIPTLEEARRLNEECQQIRVAVQENRATSNQAPI